MTAGMVGVILNLAVWFGHKVLLPGGRLDLFALTSAALSLVLLQRFRWPIHLVVPVGAAVGMIWKLAAAR